MKTGIELIKEERLRQTKEEGYTQKHDLQHKYGELGNAAAYYALTDDILDFIDEKWGNDMHLYIWPFDLKSLKRSPDNRIRDLQKAGALIAAEIDRLISENNRNEKVLNKCAECGKDFDHIPWIFASEFEIKDNEFNAKKLNHPEQFCSKECGKKYIQQNKDL